MHARFVAGGSGLARRPLVRAFRAHEHDAVLVGERGTASGAIGKFRHAGSPPNPGSLNFRVARSGQIEVKRAPPTSRCAAETPCTMPRSISTVLIRSEAHTTELPSLRRRSYA